MMLLVVTREDRGSLGWQPRLIGLATKAHRADNQGSIGLATNELIIQILQNIVLLLLKIMIIPDHNFARVITAKQLWYMHSHDFM